MDKKKNASNCSNKGMRLGKYELGRTLGEGNFGKVKFAKNVDSGQPFAVKILEKTRIIDLKITDQVSLFAQSFNLSLMGSVFLFQPFIIVQFFPSKLKLTFMNFLFYFLSSGRFVLF